MTARILSYHRICDDPIPELAGWAVTVNAFERQMGLLARLGYRGVPVAELLDRIEASDDTKKLIGLAFDDGYQDTATIAGPVLAGHGFAGTVYVVPAHIGGRAEWDQSGEGPRDPLATWEELATLRDAGWEVGHHSLTHHARLDLLRGARLTAQVTVGRDEIEAQLGVRVQTFAFPHGHHSPAAMAAVRAAGYRAAVSVIPGDLSGNSPRYALPRYEIKRRDTLPEFWLIATRGLPLRRRATVARILPFVDAPTDTGQPMTVSDAA